MKWQPQKPNTKSIFILPKNTNIKLTFNKVVLKIPIKYQENTKKFETQYQIPIWYWYFLGIPNSWLPIDITSTYIGGEAYTYVLGCPLIFEIVNFVFSPPQMVHWAQKQRM